MSINNVTKFQNIVAGLEPAKKQALYLKMKGLPENERNEMIDKVVAAYETRKLTIEQPVHAGSSLPPNNYGRTYTRSEDRLSGRKTMWVDDRSGRNVNRAPSNRATHPIKATGAGNKVGIKKVNVTDSAASVTAVRRPGSKPPIQRKAVHAPAAAGAAGASVAIRRTPVKKVSSISEAERKRQQAEIMRKVGKTTLMVLGRGALVGRHTAAVAVAAAALICSICFSSSKALSLP